MTSIYLIGSLRNARVPEIGQRLRLAGHEVFDDWYGAGPEADDHWQAYEKAKGHSFRQALRGRAAQHVFRLGHDNLTRCDAAVLVLPAGKSGHLEFGFAVGSGKRGYILLDPAVDRWDVMYNFATDVFETEEDLINGL